MEDSVSGLSIYSQAHQSWSEIILTDWDVPPLYNTLVCKWGRTQYIPVVLRVKWSIKIPTALLQLKIVSGQSVSLRPAGSLFPYSVSFTFCVNCCCVFCTVLYCTAGIHWQSSSLDSLLICVWVVEGGVFVLTLILFKHCANLAFTNTEVNQQTPHDAIWHLFSQMMIKYVLMSCTKYDMFFLDFGTWLQD